MVSVADPSPRQIDHAVAARWRKSVIIEKVIRMVLCILEFVFNIWPFLFDLSSLLLYIFGFVFNIWPFLLYMFRFYSIFFNLYSISVYFYCIIFVCIVYSVICIVYFWICI